MADTKPHNEILDRLRSLRSNEYEVMKTILDLDLSLKSYDFTIEVVTNLLLSLIKESSAKEVSNDVEKILSTIQQKGTKNG